jgi:hypothetical protein
MHGSAPSCARERHAGSRENGPGLPRTAGVVLASSATAAARAPLELSLAPKRVLCGLLVVIAVLILAGTLGVIAWLEFGRTTIWGLRRLFDLDEENNIPAYFSALQLLTAAVLLGVISRHQALIRSPWRWHFLVLAAGLAFMSVDEAAEIHGALLGRLGHSLLGDTFYWGWLGPGIVIVALVAFSYLRFLLALPRRFGALFGASGTLYVAGAVGAEWIGSEIDRHLLSDANWPRQFAVIIEEGLEMVGVALFIYALLLYIAEARIALVVRVKS